MSITKLIPNNEKELNSELIKQIAISVFGTQDDIDFTEKYVPAHGRVPGNKVSVFKQFLYENLTPGEPALL